MPASLAQNRLVTTAPPSVARFGKTRGMDLEEVVGELYGLDASEFVAARDGRARAARQSGDRGLADQVKALKRPAVAAWVVNNLVRQR
ncbi:MAG: hypothetical protein E6G01_06890, partial [Actinobacteria bacterium]